MRDTVGVLMTTQRARAGALVAVLRRVGCGRGIGAPGRPGPVRGRRLAGTVGDLVRIAPGHEGRRATGIRRRQPTVRTHSTLPVTEPARSNTPTTCPRCIAPGPPAEPHDRDRRPVGSTIGHDLAVFNRTYKLPTRRRCGFQARGHGAFRSRTTRTRAGPTDHPGRRTRTPSPWREDPARGAAGVEEEGATGSRRSSPRRST